MRELRDGLGSILVGFPACITHAGRHHKWIRAKPEVRRRILGRETAYHGRMGKLQQYRVGRTHRDANYNMVCTPQEGYHWGVAFFWIYITFLYLGLWLLGTYSIWMDAQHNSELVRKDRSTDTLRDVGDLAEAMKEIAGPETRAYSGKELKKAFKREPLLQYTVEVDEVSGIGKIVLSAEASGRMKKLGWDTVYS